MKRYFWLVISFLLITVSCCKEEIPPIIIDSEGVVIKKSYYWKKKLLENNEFNSNSYIEVPIIFNSNIILPTVDNTGNKSIILINTENGSQIWEWNDFLGSNQNNTDVNDVFIQNNLLTWQNSQRSYCINLNNGNTEWKYVREISINPHHFNSYQDKYLTYAIVNRESIYDEEVAYIGNIQTGELDFFLYANLSGEYVAPVTYNGLIGGISYINETSNEKLLLVTYSEPLPEWKVRMMFGLYNTETQEWIYERKQLVEPHWNAGVQSTPIIYNNRVYAAAGSNIVCHDVMTGEQIWAQEFDQDFLFSGFIIEDGMLLANCEDTYLYRINPELGNIEWRIKSAGTCSRMSYLNGVVYYVGGSTGYLHAVDTETGLKTVWRIDASKLGENGGSFTTNAVYCIPGENGEKGRVVALSGRYAYCFEAYR